MALSELSEAVTTNADLATALGWDSTQINERVIGGPEKTLVLSAAAIQGEGAVVFGRLADRASDEALNVISLYGYHAACPWGVVADPDGVHILSSRWLKDSDWYRLPLIPWSAVDESKRLLEAFTPLGVRDSQPHRRLLRIEAPTAFLRAVDDALVERLDSWRERAVRYSRGSVAKVDEQLQTLYAQLFVLRTIEDRGIDDTIPQLLKTAEVPEQFNVECWKLIFNRARQQISSDLFTEDVASTTDPFIVSGVIRDLYFPRRVPGRDVRYDFSWISADVLGLAYEKYLSTVLQPAPLPAQSELFLQPQRGVERLSVRKSAGAYYTPRFLTTYLAQSTVEKFYATSPEAVALPKVIDFSCGSGSFLVAAVDQILRHLKGQDPHRKWARELIEGGNIVGIDIDPKAVTAARLHLWQRLIEEPGALPLPKLSHVIRAGDGLDVGTWGELNTSYDIVLGNPPFLATSLVSNRAGLEANFQTAKGRYDFSSLFVEQAVNVLGEGGILGLVIPNRLFLNKSAEPLRTVISQNTELGVVVDFGSTRLFDADAYVGCIVARKGGNAKVRHPVRVIQVRSLEPDFMTAELIDAEHSDIGSATSSVASYESRQPGSAPWALLSNSDRRNRVLMDEVSVRLDTIATVKQGIRTGVNDLFILEVEEDDGTSLCKIKNGLGEQWFLERDLLEPVVFGSELERYSIVEPTRRILYPYRRNVALSELELKDRYPQTFEYLWFYRDLLSARSSLKGTGSEYWELIRPRDERWMRRPKLLIRDLAPATAFAIDERGSAFLVGGTAVVPVDPELCVPLAAYLNSRVVSALVKQQTPSFRGDFQKFEPGVLSAIPVLQQLTDDDAFAAKLKELGQRCIGLEAGSADLASIEAQIDGLIIESANTAGAELAI